jgi:hypothetical protein
MAHRTITDQKAEIDRLKALLTNVELVHLQEALENSNRLLDKANTTSASHVVKISALTEDNSRIEDSVDYRHISYNKN